MKRIAIFIPIKTKSSRVEGKNFKYLGNKKLYQYQFDQAEKLKSLFPDNIEIFVDSDSPEISREANIRKFNFIKRELVLSSDFATGDDLLRYHISINSDFDVYAQQYITCPFQKWSSILRCLLSLESGYDSSFLAHMKNTWYWYNGVPLNYEIGKFGRSQDNNPVIMETTGFYCITKEAFEKTNARIGLNPLIQYVGLKESIDIDTEEDFKLAEILCKHDI